MKKSIFIFTSIAFMCCSAGFFITGCSSLHKINSTRNTSDYSVAVSTEVGVNEGNNEKGKFKSFCVYTDEKSQQNHYYPSGWMGDTQDIKFTGAYQDNPKLGKTCLRITYLGTGPKEWAGIYWQNPANNWGTSKGGYDLRGARYLTFWARGEEGREKISEIKMGGITGKNPDSDIAWIGPLKLKKDWTQYRISLKKKDLRYISGGFCFTALKADNPHGCTFYLDEIRYE